MGWFAQGILDEWFLGKVNDLGSVANIWRNELAYEKRSYKPDERAISAVRLVEYLRIIALRQAGYADDEVRHSLEQVLTC